MRTFPLLVLLFTTSVSAQAASLQSLECNAVNALGFAQLRYDAETNVITSIVNGGFMRLDYKVAYVEKAYDETGKGQIALEGAQNQFYDLSFDQPLKAGKQSVTGRLRYIPKGGFIFGGPALPMNAVTTISTVSCDLTIGR